MLLFAFIYHHERSFHFNLLLENVIISMAPSCFTMRLGRKKQTLSGFSFLYFTSEMTDFKILRCMLISIYMDTAVNFNLNLGCEKICFSTYQGKWTVTKFQISLFKHIDHLLKTLIVKSTFQLCVVDRVRHTSWWFLLCFTHWCSILSLFQPNMIFK